MWLTASNNMAGIDPQQPYGLPPASIWLCHTPAAIWLIPATAIQSRASGASLCYILFQSRLFNESLDVISCSKIASSVRQHVLYLVPKSSLQCILRQQEQTATAGAVTATAGAVTATAGAVTATAGAVTATAGAATAGAVTATAGAVTTTAGAVTATAGAATAGAVTATAGAVTATAGAVTATAGAATAGAVTATAGAVTATAGAVTATAGAGNSNSRSGNSNSRGRRGAAGQRAAGRGWRLWWRGREPRAGQAGPSRLRRRSPTKHILSSVCIVLIEVVALMRGPHSIIVARPETQMDLQCVETLKRRPGSWKYGFCVMISCQKWIFSRSVQAAIARDPHSTGSPFISSSLSTQVSVSFAFVYQYIYIISYTLKYYIFFLTVMYATPIKFYDFYRHFLKFTLLYIYIYIYFFSFINSPAFH
ncbi:uncharacterized protein [Panulirus ornatus]|uniref:uncharacterized protein n=1 Tax=Panulirus ornatus TaxID=150431 RepID=UPI003A87EFB2